MERSCSPVAAFDLSQGKALVAFVGGGGKTTLIFALAEELARAGRRVVVTTTTRLFAAQMGLAPAVYQADSASGVVSPRLASELSRHFAGEGPEQSFCLVLGGPDPDEPDKVQGISPQLAGRLLAHPAVDVVLVEADGARMRPVKAPAAHEPVLPPKTTLLVPVAGIDALAAPIAVVAHRPELVSRLTGRSTEETLSPADLARLLTHAQGGLKGAPAGARAIPFINKVESEAQRQLARDVAHYALQSGKVEQVVLGAAAQGGNVVCITQGARAQEGPPVPQ